MAGMASQGGDVEVVVNSQWEWAGSRNGNGRHEIIQNPCRAIVSENITLYR